LSASSIRPDTRQRHDSTGADLMSKLTGTPSALAALSATACSTGCSVFSTISYSVSFLRSLILMVSQGAGGLPGLAVENGGTSGAPRSSAWARATAGARIAAARIGSRAGANRRMADLYGALARAVAAGRTVSMPRRAALVAPARSAPPL
jgi:hypothetical protein